MPSPRNNHYATLGLHQRCTLEEIRAAYRILAKQHHPDLNPHSAAAVVRTQELNAAYEVLNNAARRAAYDQELDSSAPAGRTSASGSQVDFNVTQEVALRLEEFLRGITLEVLVSDPGNPSGPETYPLIIPPETAPGTRFRVPRAAPFEGGRVIVKTTAKPDFRFKVRGSDLRCELKIKPERAAQGGTEMVRGLSGALLRVEIPRGTKSGTCVSVPGEGLPKPRGGRGDLLVRITYRPLVRITRVSK
jgi:DnaJ-class molecular chaperone